ncbi:DUF4883 family protein [Clostridium sp. JNZ J1-5]
MKKGSLIFLILILIIGICTSVKFYLNRQKPSNFYYTNSLAKNLTLSNKYDVKILDTNFYKTESLSEDNIEMVKSFLKELRKPNFVPKPVSLNSKPKYKMFFTFPESQKKFVVNIYDSEYISIFPWDGEFQMDYINMKNIPARYNLYSISKNAFIKEPKFD